MRNVEAVRRYRAKNPDKCKQLTREWNARNKERVAAYSRKCNLLKRGFTLDGYALARAVQGQACAICQTPFDELPQRAIHADHDHQSKEPRGVLCHHCNAGLGLFRDSPELLAAAASYLASPTMKEIVMLEPKVDELKAAVLENTAVLRELIAALANGQPITAKSTDKAFPESTTDTRTVKEVSDQIQADNAKVKTKTETKKAEPEAAATPEAKGDGAAAISLQDVIDVTLALGKAGKRAALVELLEVFGVAKSSLLDESDYIAFHTKATALLEG